MTSPGSWEDSPGSCLFAVWEGQEEGNPIARCVLFVQVKR